MAERKKDECYMGKETKDRKWKVYVILRKKNYINTFKKEVNIKTGLNIEDKRKNGSIIAVLKVKKKQ